jgi:hypothetical protein
MSWVGINLEDGSPWSSRDPQPVAWEDVKHLSDGKVGSAMMDKDRLIEDLRRNSNERLEEARRLRGENESLMDERDMWREKYYELKRSVTPGSDHNGTK